MLINKGKFEEAIRVFEECCNSLEKDYNFIIEKSEGILKLVLI